MVVKYKSFHKRLGTITYFFFLFSMAINGGTSYVYISTDNQRNSNPGMWGSTTCQKNSFWGKFSQCPSWPITSYVELRKTWIADVHISTKRVSFSTEKRPAQTSIQEQPIAANALDKGTIIFGLNIVKADLFFRPLPSNQLSVTNGIALNVVDLMSARDSCGRFLF